MILLRRKLETNKFLKLNKQFSLSNLSFLLEDMRELRKKVSTSTVRDKFDLVNHEFDFNSINALDNLPNKQPYNYNEILLCKILNQHKKNFSVRLLTLKPHGVFRTRQLEIFHEHILKRSVQSEHANFELMSVRVEFKRPSLYEYAYLKEQSAVSSHFSVITLVPMLLELNKNSRLLECGTGSGSMTLFLSEHLGNTGLLHTVEFHLNRALKAKKSFYTWKNSYDLRWTTNSLNKWPENVKFFAADFCNHQFNDEMIGFYDSVYLDMQKMDFALTNVNKILRVGGVLVTNTMHLTQVLRLLNVIREKKLGYEVEMIIEPGNRFWELKKIRHNNTNENEDTRLEWTCRQEDRFIEKHKRGGLFFNYWSGFLAKLRKIY
jgi:tRNA A58 N-methylase Trm61